MKKNIKVHFSSLRLDWKTPKHLIKGLEGEFGLMFDPCPTLPEEDGLKIKWGSPAFVNPPYGREIGNWCKKAYEESKRGITVIMLIPSRTDTRWWHDYIMKADEIRFIKGRLHFDEHKNPTPFPSCVVVFEGKK